MSAARRDELSADDYNAIAKERTNKYRNQPTNVAGTEFDSKLEAQRYKDLRIMETAGVISALEVHPRFDLVVNGVRIGRYTADFRYVDTDSGVQIVEDVKSRPTRTRDYMLRKKLMKAVHGIEIKEVTT